jgi:aminoglycoside/choline kinase family phosphotransferase
MGSHSLCRLTRCRPGSIVISMSSIPDALPPLHLSTDLFGQGLSIRHLQTLVDKAFPGSSADFQVWPLLGDASDRQYYRLRFKTPVNGLTSVVLMRLAKSYTSGELPFANVQRYLSSKGIPVPALFCDDSLHGFVLLEDLGDVTLQDALQGAGREQMAGAYTEALDILLTLQRPASMAPRGSCVAFCLAFDVDKLMWELDFFLTHMIKQLCCRQLKLADEAALRGQFWKISSRLALQPRVLTHRDYHSRNLMWHQGQLRVIDFQDARLGPCQYDLASLLYDAYVVLPSDLRETLLAYYLERKASADGHQNHEGFRLIFDYMCLQRHLKALGTFAFQTVVKQNQRYTSAIPTTLGYIQDTLAKHPELHQLMKLLEEYLFAIVPTVLQDVGTHTPDKSPIR